MIKIIVGVVIGTATALLLLAGRGETPRTARGPSPTPIPKPEVVHKPLPSTPPVAPRPAATRRATPLAEIGEKAGIAGASLGLLKGVLDSAKEDYFDLLATPRVDGGSWVADFATPGADRGAAMLRIFTDDVPGTGEKYATRIAKLQRATWERLWSVLEPAALEKLRQLAPDPMEISTGRDPFAEYCRGRGVAPLAE